jgi:hypothetical protein
MARADLNSIVKGEADRLGMQTIQPSLCVKKTDLSAHLKILTCHSANKNRSNTWTHWLVPHRFLMTSRLRPLVLSGIIYDFVD